MSGRQSRDKGARTERAIARVAGFAQLYDWLNDSDELIVKADRQEPLVVLRMSFAAEIAKRTT
jgi:hypothetical protein